MNAPKQELGSALLAQLPRLSDLPKLKAEISAAVKKEQAKMNRQRIVVQIFWIFCAVMATGYMWFGPESERGPRAPFLACFFILWGGIEVLKHRIHSARVEILTEIKQLQLQMLELRVKTEPKG